MVSQREQDELLRLLEDEQQNMLVLIHRIPRPYRQEQAPPLRTGDRKRVLSCGYLRADLRSSVSLAQRGRKLPTDCGNIPVPSDDSRRSG